MQKVIALLLSIVVALLGAMAFIFYPTTTLTFNTPYQAVVLVNGQVYFGKLRNTSSQYPELRDVFYVISQGNPETKQVSNILVRRGKELHGPDYMILNRQSILMIEPVNEISQVAKLIAEQNASPR